MANVNEVIGPALVAIPLVNQADVDARLLSLDGTLDKSRLGANAVLGVSMAFARARAVASGEPLHQNLAANDSTELPVPMFNVLNGGVHADSSVDLQEFMIAPVGAASFREAVRMGSETYQALKATLKQRGYGTAVGDEGGFAPSLKANVEAIEVILAAIEHAGLRPGSDVVLALDPASSEFYENGSYVFRKSDGSRKTRR